MKEFLITMGIILMIGIVVLLCFFSCIISDEYWETKKKEMERRNGRH